MAVHHTGVELIGMHLTLGGDQHVADHAQAIHIRVERAQAVGELFRQHGNHTAREVHTGRALVGIHVNRIAVLHIVTHIGNRHQQTPALAATDLGRLAVHSIVKVARIFAINGAQRHIAQINATLAILGHHLFRQGLGCRQTGFREHMGHAILAHRNFNFHAGVIHLPQHFQNAAYRLTKQGWSLGQFNHHHLPRLGLPRCPLRHQYILTIALVFGRHQPDAAFLQQAANQGLGRPLDDLHDMPFRAAALVLANDVHAHAILVEHGTHFVGGNVDIGLAIVTNDESMTVSMPLHRSFNFLERIARVGAWVHFFAIQSKSFLKAQVAELVDALVSGTSG